MRVYFAIYKAALKARMEYRVDFAVGVVVAIAMQLSALAFFWVVFARTPTLAGWTPHELLFLFGMTALVLGFSEATLNGIWWLSYYIIDGQLDRLLIYPVDSLLFVLLSRPELHSLGNFTAGSIMVGIAWSFSSAPLAALALLPVWVVSGAVIYTGLLVIVGVLLFRAAGPWSTHLFAVHQLLSASRYPVPIYPRWLQYLVLYVFPFGAAIYLPADFLRGHASFVSAALVPPLAALATAFVAKRAWHGAIGWYQSTGS